MRTLFTLISLMIFSTSAYAESSTSNISTNKNEVNDLLDCDSNDKKCLAQNEEKLAKTDNRAQKIKNRRAKEINKRKKLIGKPIVTANKKTNINDADLKDTSKPNSFIADTESNSAPAKNPTTPPKIDKAEY